MTKNELQNGDSETEILLSEDEKLQQMLCGLKKVNAPKNFDFHLKARIAKANPEEFQTASPFAFLRYFLPFGAVTLLAIFVGFNLLLSADSKDVAQATEKTPQSQNVRETVPANSSASSTALISQSLPPETANAQTSKDSNLAPDANEKKNAETTPTLITLKNNSNSLPKPKNNDEEFGGTRESTSTQGKVITPRGIDLNQNSKKVFDFGGSRTISVEESLNTLGVEVVFESGNWKVLSVTENTTAASFGLKTGDLIEAIGENKLASETLLNQTLSGNIIHIIRDGKRISLKLSK